LAFSFRVSSSTFRVGNSLSPCKAGVR